MVKAIISNDPSPFVGRRVTVCVTSVHMTRVGFHTQVSVEGSLERHPKDNFYRIVVSDGNYTYFKPSDIDAIVSSSSREWNTRSGSVAVIYLNFELGKA